ncbi:hypothetical protein CS238_05400 [Salmonella enterica]|nr:hypothetical protein [Salmonella enterica]EJC8747823.1 hypothetical protein [Salmonella enterica]HCM1648884.1 hypothetical protein [Salmonella enterica subsp. diarizonae serovar 48:i:z35]
MMIYNVFGRFIGVKREGERWLLFNVNLTERKYSRIYDVIIPDFITEQEIPRWLDDIYHEATTSSHPDVYRVE